jgi:hypothetical protein
MTDSPIQPHILARAIKDAAFRQAFASNPRETLAKEYNVHFPESVTIRVLEDTPTLYNIVLPPQEAAMQELSDTDLEAVAGGVPAPTFHACGTKSCKINC